MARIIPEKESLTVEFKSDQKRLPDRDLLEAVVCLANSDGGDIYLGVENDGTPTGLHPEHMNLTGMVAMIANRTIPPISVRVEPIDTEDVRVAKIQFPVRFRFDRFQQPTVCFNGDASWLMENLNVYRFIHMNSADVPLISDCSTTQPCRLKIQHQMILILLSVNG